MRAVVNSSCRTAGVVLLVSALTAGCAPNAIVETGGVRPAVTAIPSGTGDSRAVAAVHTYEAFTQAHAVSQQAPVAPGRALPDGGDFTRYSFDPVRAEYESGIHKLFQDKRQYRGTPPTSDITVTSIALDAVPSPMITLSDCRAGHDAWQEVDATTGAPVAEEAPVIAPPFGATITVIFYHQRWGVQTITRDPSRTCPG